MVEIVAPTKALGRRHITSLVVGGIWFLLLCLLMMCIVAFGNSLLVLVTFAVICAWMILQLRLFEKGYSIAVVAFVVYAVFQNTILGLSFNLTKTPSVSAGREFLATTTVFIAVLFLFAISRWKQSTKTSQYHKLVTFGIVGLIYLAGVLVISHQPIMSRFAYLRNFSSPMLFVISGFLLIENESQLNTIVSAVRKIGFISAVIGLLVFAFAGFGFWFHLMHLNIVFDSKGLIMNSINSYPGEWYSGILGYNGLRLASVMFDPVNYSYILTVTFLLEIMQFKKNPSLGMLRISILLVTEFLTIGKGGWLCLVVALFYVFLTRISVKPSKAIVASFIVGIGSILWYYKSGTGTVEAPHLAGLVSGFTGMLRRPLGHGIGAGGNFGQLFGGVSLSNWLSSGAESSFGDISFQLGVLGVLVIYGFWFVLILTAARQTQKISIYLTGALIGLFIASFMQENSLGPEVDAAYFILAGAVLRVQRWGSSENSMGWNKH